MQTGASPTTFDLDTMGDKGFALRFLPFLAPEGSQRTMYGTVFASGSSYLDNTGINLMWRKIKSPVIIGV